MEPRGVVLVEVSTQAAVSVSHRRIFHDVNVVIFDRPPQPLDKDVIQIPAASVHTDSDLVFQQYLDKDHRCKLDALIAVEDIRPTVRQRVFQALYTKRRVQRVRQPPGQDITAEPVNDRHQITEPLPQLHIRDVNGPDLVGPYNLNTAQ